MTDNIDKEQELQAKILAVLLKATTPLSPPDIAHQCGFLRPNNQASNVNPTLYKLLDRGLIVKSTNWNGKKPHYALAKNTTPFEEAK